MDIIRNLLLQLKNQSVDIVLNEDQLEVFYDGEDLDPIIYNEIKDNKDQIIEFLQNNQGSHNGYPLISLGIVQENYPLSPSQSRLWVVSQLKGGSAAYNISSAVRIFGKINVKKFEETFVQLICRHEILRTYFKPGKEGDIRQYILSEEKVFFKIENIDYSLIENQDQAVHDYVQKKSREPFNLEIPSLLRASLIHVKKEEYIFFLSLHHIIGDGWSMELLISEILNTYTSLIQGKKADLPVLNIQYKDYAIWLNNLLEHEKFKQSEKYWLQKLGGKLPVLELPILKKRPLVKDYKGNSVGNNFSNEFLEKIKEFSNKQKGTLFMTLVAGINVLLHKYSAQEDIIIGTPIAGREYPDLEKQLGLYLNTLAIRTQVKKESSFLNLLKTQKETLLNAYEHQSYPFDVLIDKLNLKRDTGRSVLFDVMIVLQNQIKSDHFEYVEFSDLKISNYDLKNETSKFDIIFTFIEQKGLTLVIQYDTAIYNDSFIKRIFGHFEKLMIGLLERPDIAIKDVDYFTDNERQELKEDHYSDIECIESSEHYALSYEQKRLWLLSLDEKASLFYNMSFCTELERDIDFVLFEKAVWATIERHEILRTVFKEDQTGEIRQWVLPVEQLNFVLDYVDFRGRSDQDYLIGEYINDKSGSNFDLEQGALIRAGFLVLEDKQLLYCNIHHIIGDGWSMDILTRDIKEYYDSFVENSVASLPLLRIQYKDYAAWQVKQVSGIRFQQQSDYWKTLFKEGIPRIKFPFEKRRPESFTYTGNRTSFKISRDQKEFLSELSRANSGSMYVTFMFLVKLILNKYCKEDLVMIGSSFSTRNHIDLEDQIGFYVNNLPLVSNIISTDTLKNAYDCVKNTILNVNSHSWFPLELVLDQIKYKHERSYSGIFNVFAEYHQKSSFSSDTAVLEEGFFENNLVFDFDVPCQFDLSLDFLEKQDYIDCVLVYNNSLFDRNQIELLVERFLNVIEQLSTNTAFFNQTRVVDLDLDTSQETNVFKYSSAALLEENF